MLLTACKNPEEPSLSLPPVVPGTVVFFDDFDGENSGKGVYNWTNFKNWNVIAGCVDLAGNGFHDLQPGRGLYVDLDGTCKKAGTLESKTTFVLEPGEYLLEFWYAGNQRWETVDTLIVSLGPTFSQEFTVNKNPPFQLYSRSISVQEQTSAKLKFAHSGGDDRGILLDLVRLRRGP
jgi:hypothetical protein